MSMLRHRVSPTKTDNNYLSQPQTLPNHPSLSVVAIISGWSLQMNGLMWGNKAAIWAEDLCRTRYLLLWPIMHHLPLYRIMSANTRIYRRKMNNLWCRERHLWLTACQLRWNRKLIKTQTRKISHHIRLWLWARLVQCRLWQKKIPQLLNRLSNETILSSRTGVMKFNKKIMVMKKTPMKRKEDKLSEKKMCFSRKYTIDITWNSFKKKARRLIVKEKRITSSSLITWFLKIRPYPLILS